jgi:hypothetical protein
MKTAVLNRIDFPIAPYPNAATIRQILHKIMNHMLIIASCAGIASVILLLFTLA